MTKIISQCSPQITLTDAEWAKARFLTDIEWAEFMSDLDNPAPANQALKDAMRRVPLWKAKA